MVDANTHQDGEMDDAMTTFSDGDDARRRAFSWASRLFCSLWSGTVRVAGLALCA
jgi:hypothetical protein